MIDIKELKADFKDFANVKTSWENWMYIHKDKDDLTEKVFVDYMQNLGFDLKKNLESNDDKTVSDK